VFFTQFPFRRCQLFRNLILDTLSLANPRQQNTCLEIRQVLVRPTRVLAPSRTPVVSTEVQKISGGPGGLIKAIKSPRILSGRLIRVIKHRTKKETI
jgi:hypothetical protein